MKRILQKTVRPPSIATVVTGSVCRRVGAAVFVAVVILEAAVTVPIYLQEKRDFDRQRSAEALALFTSAVDPARFPSVEALSKSGEGLVNSSKIAGGAVISGAGEERSIFGQMPALTWADARLNGESTRFSSATGAFDVFLSPEDTKLPYGVILRLDATEDWNRLSRHLVDWILMSLLVAAAASTVAALIVAREVARPLHTIHSAVEFTLNNPEDAEGTRTGVSRNDEIGSLARAIDQLLFLTSSTFADELAAAVSILEKAPHAILTFSEHGHLVSANPAALRLFGETSFASLLRRDPESLFRYGGKTISAAGLADRGGVLGPGEILNATGDFPCLIAGDTVKRADGTILRRFLMFVDMRDLVDGVRNEVRRRESGDREVRRLNGELQLLRQMFEACLVVTGLDGNEADRANEVTVIPQGLVEAWRSRLAKEGHAIDRIGVSDLPPVIGDSSALRRLFDIALEIVRLRSRSDNPRIVVSGVARNGTATFAISETDGAGGTVAISSRKDLTVLVGALGVLCKRQKGMLTAVSDGGDANRLSFQLKPGKPVAIPGPSESEAA